MDIKKSKNDIICFAKNYMGLRLKEWQIELLRNRKKVMKNVRGRSL